MAEIQVGTLAVHWTFGAALSGTGVGTNTPQNMDIKHESEKAQTKGSDGNTVNHIFYDRTRRISIDVIPTGTTRALAKAADILPSIGSVVALVDSTDVDLTSTANYIVMAASKKKSNTGAAMITLDLEKNLENDIAVVLV